MRFTLFPMRIRLFIILWSGSIVLAWLLLLAGWTGAQRELTAISEAISADIRALDVARELELAILAFRREDLIWQATGNPYRNRRALEQLEIAEVIADRLSEFITSDEEKDLVESIQVHLPTLRASVDASGQSTVEYEAQMLDDLFFALRAYRLQNERQAEESIADANALRREITLWMIAFAIGTACLLAIGAVNLLQRIVRPVLALTDTAARFGRGDLQAAAPVLYNDEIGALARTFNSMAGDIANREKDRLRFVAAVVHDLKNPVLVVEMAAMLLKSANEQDQRNRYIDAINDEVHRLRRIIRDLTDDVQVTSGSLTLKIDLIDFGQLVRSFVESQAEAISTHHVDLTTEAGCMVDGDAYRLERVVMNVLSNALKYSPVDTRVELRVFRSDGRVVFTITDHGPGISIEDQKLLFQPFGRGPAANAIAEGTGIGLYVVKQIVEAHGGAVGVQSNAGQGTTFTISLPAAAAVDQIAIAAA